MKTVLIADSDYGVVVSLEDLLLEKGYRVFVCYDGASAWTIVHSERPDLVVTGLDLPFMNGFALAKAIRRDRGLAALPIIVLTGDGVDFGAMGEGLFDAAFSKPGDCWRALSLIETLTSTADPTNIEAEHSPRPAAL